MPELIEQMYCSQQIVVPPKFPYILKKFAKAAIKTQPYDLLRWSCEYFLALSEARPPPVKLRLEYPIYTTPGGLTTGYLRTLFVQLQEQKLVSKVHLENTWLGTCLDPAELSRILCLCGVGQREELQVPTLIFFAVSAGLLTKSLTQTMILLCETMTKEPEGGSATIPIDHFLTMYHHLAALDCSSDITYIDGRRIDEEPLHKEEEIVEEESAIEESSAHNTSTDEFTEVSARGRHLALTGDCYARATRVSEKLARVHAPEHVISPPARSLSRERVAESERRQFSVRKGRAIGDPDVDKQLREMSKGQLTDDPDADKDDKSEGDKEGKMMDEDIEIMIYDEDENVLPLVIYGTECFDKESYDEEYLEEEEMLEEEMLKKPSLSTPAENPIELLLQQHRENRLQRIEDLERTFDELAVIVNRWKHVNYDYGMVAGRQLSTTSGEFIAESVRTEILAYVDEQIAILPDPDLKKKKARPEEVEMIKDLLETFVGDKMSLIVPEAEMEEEEEEIPPELVLVYAVPGIGPPVPEDIVAAFTKHALTVSATQADLIMPRNIRHFLCPPLENYMDPLEEVPAAGGAITE